MSNKTEGLRLYEHLKTFSEYRSQNESELQQALYSDMLTNLSGEPPKTDAEATSVIYLLVSSLLELVAKVSEVEDFYEEIHAEIREILAIVAHYNVKGSE